MMLWPLSLYRTAPLLTSETTNKCSVPLAACPTERVCVACTCHRPSPPVVLSVVTLGSAGARAGAGVTTTQAIFDISFEMKFGLISLQNMGHRAIGHVWREHSAGAWERGSSASTVGKGVSTGVRRGSHR